MTEPLSDSVDVRWQTTALPRFAKDKPRYAIGIALNRAANSIVASLVRCLGRGVHMVCDVIGHRESRLSPELGLAVDQNNGPRASVEQATRSRVDLAEFNGELIRPLVANAKRDYDEVLVIGVRDLGVWIDDRVSGAIFQPICDCSVLAETTGITVVDDFPTRDIIHGGLGGPTNVLPDWILFGDRSGIPGIRNRGVLRLEETFRLNVIPNRNLNEPPSNYVALDIQPGLNLVSAIRDRFRAGDVQVYAPNYIVQGRIVSSLLTDWHAIPSAPKPWSPNQQLDSEYGQAIDQHMNQSSINLQDVIATAVRYLADNVAAQIAQAVPDSMPIFELVVSGPLQNDGGFAGRLEEKLGVKVSPQQYVTGSDKLEGASAAILALARIDHLIGNAYRSSQTKTPRCLGRITPGNPGNWERVTIELYRQMCSKLKLKEAI